MKTTKTIALRTYKMQQMILQCSIVLLVLFALTTYNTTLPAPRLSATTVIANKQHSISVPRATQIPGTTGDSHHYTTRKTNKAKLQIKTPANNDLNTCIKGCVAYMVCRNAVVAAGAALPDYYLFLFRYTPF